MVKSFWLFSKMVSGRSVLRPLKGYDFAAAAAVSTQLSNVA